MNTCCLIGPVKSGTTLLISLLDSHLELLLFPIEVKFFTHWVERLAVDTVRYQDLNHFFLKNSKIKLMDPIETNTADIMNSGRIDFSGFNYREFEKIMEESARRPENSKLMGQGLFQKYLLDIHDSLNQLSGGGKARTIVSKEGNHGGKYISTICSIFPQTKFIVVVRDPRDIFVSFKTIAKKKLEGVRSPTFKKSVSPCRYIHGNKGKNISAYDKIASNHSGDPNFCFVRYDDLVRKPALEMKRVAAFLDIEYTDNLLIPTNFGNPWGGNASSMVGFNGLATNRIGKWEEELKAPERRIIDFFLYDYLSRGGYQVSPSRPQKIRVLRDIVVTELGTTRIADLISARGLFHFLKNMGVMVTALYSCMFNFKILGR